MAQDSIRFTLYDLQYTEYPYVSDIGSATLIELKRKKIDLDSSF